MMGGFVTAGCATVERLFVSDGSDPKKEYARVNVSWEVPKNGSSPVTYVARYATLVAFGATSRVVKNAQPGDRIVVLDGDAQIGKPYQGKNGTSTPLDIYVSKWLLIPAGAGAIVGGEE